MSQHWRKVWIHPVRRKRGTSYQVCFLDLATKRRRVRRSFPQERLAEGYARQFEMYLNGMGPEPGDFVEPTTRRPWTETVESWLAGGAKRAKTRSQYSKMLSRFAHRTGVEYVEDVTEQTIAAFLRGLREQGRSLSTTAAYLRVLASFFKAVRPGGTPVTKGLLAEWKPYKLRKRQRPHVYSDDEVARMLRACDDITVSQRGQRDGLWWRTFLTLLWRTGLRLSEAAHLIWQDIDFSEGLVLIQPHTGLPGVAPWRPKGKQRRALPLPDDLLDLLTRMQQRQPEGVPYVFVTKARYDDLLRKGLPEGDDILTGVRKGFVRIRRRAGVHEGTIHDWRRTAITNWCRHPELTPNDVQILAGHESITTTLAVYNMVSEEDVVAKAKRLFATPNAATPLWS